MDMDQISRAAERRRAAEAERRKRIFNHRQRVIGLDVQALEQQVAEKRQREEADRQQKMSYDALCFSMDINMTEQQTAEEKRRRELAQELVQYWAMYQRSEDSRDADLKSKHQRGLVSLPGFEGEGIDENERKKNQKEQNEQILRAQREEQERCLKLQKRKELLRGLELIEQDLNAVHLDALEEECRKTARIALKSYNQAQAIERQLQERQDKQKCEGMEMAEILQVVNSDLLTECPEAAVKEGLGSDEAPRVLTDRWKGMSSEQLGAIYRQRAEQRGDRERRRQQEKQSRLAYDLQQLEMVRQQAEEEKRMRELERAKRAQLDQYNQQLAREQRAHQQYLNNELYTNRPTMRYFSQFNASTR